jgi:hypothetical protein
MALRLQLFWDGTTGAKLYKVSGSAGSPTYDEITIPEGLTLTKRRPCFSEFYDGYVIITNFWAEPIVVYDDGEGNVNAWLAGLDAPTVTPTVEAQAGGSLTAVITRAYITYAHETPSGVKLAESNPGDNLLASELDVTDAKIVFSGLPTESPDGRVNRIYGYLGLEGYIPRRVFNVAFGA